MSKLKLVVNTHVQEYTSVVTEHWLRDYAHIATLSQKEEKEKTNKEVEGNKILDSMEMKIRKQNKYPGENQSMKYLQRATEKEQIYGW